MFDRQTQHFNEHPAVTDPVKTPPKYAAYHLRLLSVANIIKASLLGSGVYNKPCSDLCALHQVVLKFDLFFLVVKVSEST